MAVSYFADSATDYGDTDCVRSKLPGGLVLYFGKLYMSGNYTQLANWTVTAGSTPPVSTTSDGLIPSSVFGMSRVLKLQILTPIGAHQSTTDRQPTSGGFSVNTTPSAYSGNLTALNFGWARWVPTRDTSLSAADKRIATTAGFSGGIQWYSLGATSAANTGSVGLKDQWSSAEAAANNLGTSPAATALDVLVIGVG